MSQKFQNRHYSSQRFAEFPRRAVISVGIAPSVHLVGADELLFRRIMALLPEHIEVERYQSLDEISVSSALPALTLYQTQRIDEAERRRIERHLQEAPRRLVVLCDQADPPDLFGLAVTGAFLGLTAIESNRSRKFLAGRLKTWYWEGLIRPDWTALGAPAEAAPPYHVGRMITLIERNPSHDWRVEELARQLRISDRTLNRAVQDFFGITAKSLLMALRHQLIARTREAKQHTWEELAEIFGFASAKEIQEWQRRYKRGTPSV